MASKTKPWEKNSKASKQGIIDSVKTETRQSSSCMLVIAKN